MARYTNDKRRLSAGEAAALSSVLGKLSRIFCGVYHEDNYIDGAAYLAIAGELAGADPYTKM